MVEKSIYLDHHATTPTDSRVLAEMWPFFTEHFGNPSSVDHSYGTTAAAAVETARESIAELVDCRPQDVIVTSGATEANNLAIKGWAARHRYDCRVVTTPVEHKSVLDPAQRVRRLGARLQMLKIDAFGAVCLESLAEILTKDRGDSLKTLVSVIGGNNEIGTLNDLPAIAAMCQEHNAMLHVDATQLPAGLPVDSDSCPADLLSLSSHKIYGPPGVGVLILRKQHPRPKLVPLIEGGGQEQNLRSGTLPLPLIVGFGAACRIAIQERDTRRVHLQSLRDAMWASLQNSVSDLVLNGHPSRRLPGNLNFSVPGVDGDALLSQLTAIAVSSGSACTSGFAEPSHVLRSLGRSPELARASIRIGLGCQNRLDEIPQIVEHIAATVRRLRR